MRSFGLKKTVGIFAIGLALVLGTSMSASAQTWGHNQNLSNKMIKQQEKLAKQRQKLAELQRKNAQKNMVNRYRVNRNGSWYNTDQRGADLLRQAVNAGYQQGFRAGQADRNSRRHNSYSNSSVYRNGNYGYQSYVSSSQYQYYFQQGFQRGYQDGYNSQHRYGSNNNGGLNILGSILGQILNIQRY